jgi:HPt (histidine-containing phosphotransfer) domain-containing protein
MVKLVEFTAHAMRMLAEPAKIGETHVPNAASNQPAPEALVDLDAALLRLGGDDELLRDLIGYFFEDAPPLLDSIQRGLASREATLVERSAHSLKGLAANFTGQRAVRAAMRLEKQAHTGDLSDGQSLAAELEQEVAALRGALALYLNASDEHPPGK